jgi:hypothetical protein
VAATLVPLATVEVTLADPITVGEGPSGVRSVVEVRTVAVTGERLRGHLHGVAAADWFTVAAGVLTLDVRFTLETDDGALVFVQYRGRGDVSGGFRGLRVVTAPLFETADPRYRWLNALQAVGVGGFADGVLRYDWYEVR